MTTASSGVTTTGGGAGTDPLAGTRSGASSTLSPWASSYVTNFLSRAQALGDEDYQVYGGPLTAGQSELQTKAFQGLGNLTLPTGAQTLYTPQTFTAQSAQDYMNPYLSAALNPQIEDIRRNAAIQRVQDAGRMTRAGAFGGGRQAVSESLGNEAALRQISRTLGEGYKTAFDKAMDQFNVEQNREMGAAKQAGEYGLAALGAQLKGGDIQRAIESEGVAADLAEFRKQAEFPYKQLEFQRQMISDLPIQTQNYSYNAPSDFNQLVGIATQLGTLLQNPTVKEIFESLFPPN
jgi:hypothetical protein